MPTPHPSSAAEQASRWDIAGWATGMKMLVILTVALLPLGLIALFASIQSDRVKRAQRIADAQVIATAEARQIDILVLRGSNTLRGILSIPNLDAARCDRLLERNATAVAMPLALAIFAADGRLRCATSSFRQAPALRPRPGLAVTIVLGTDPERLLFVSGMPDGSYGIGELPLPLLRQAMPASGGAQSISLRQGPITLPLVTAGRGSPLRRHIVTQAPIAGGQSMLRLSMMMNALSAVEVLLALLPLLMWASAAGIGWLVVDRLLLRPLKQLQRAVSLYRPGGANFTLPPISSPAHEIGTLAAAFSDTTALLAEREAALERGLSDQVRLTREVHHRVKNNLQVVASLINLHARGTDGDVAAAYASIQRRVDALAVVHRNHYAELEENRGVALRSIVAELTANLRATAPPAASNLTITLDMIPAFITQDVAVPIAFLVTEVVELVMRCDPAGHVGIGLVNGSVPDRALLTIDSPSLASEACLRDEWRDRFQRITTGLSRQLRTQLVYDAATGRHEILIATLPISPEEHASQAGG